MHLLRAIRERIAFWRWYLMTYRPIAGADDGDGEGGSEGGTGQGSAAGSDGGDGNDGGEGSGEGSGSGDGGDDGQASGSGAGNGDDDNTVTLPKDEAERLRRQVAEAAKEKRDRERKEAEDAGEHQKVVQGVEQERDEAVRERDEAREELATFKNQATVRTVAESLNFHDTEDAVLRVPNEVAERGEAAITKHLRDVITKSPHLIGEGAPRSGASLSGNEGGGGGSNLTADDVKSMSRDEIKDRWDEVQEALKRGS